MSSGDERAHPHTDPDDLGLVDALAQLSFAVQNALARRAAAHDLSMTQIRLLGVLRDRTPGMREIAGLLELDKSSITGLVDRAERRGLVRREASPDDRRVSRIALTSAGRALAATVASDFETDVRALVNGMDPDDVATLSRIASTVALNQVRRSGDE